MATCCSSGIPRGVGGSVLKGGSVVKCGGTRTRPIAEEEQEGQESLAACCSLVLCARVPIVVGWRLAGFMLSHIDRLAPRESTG